MRGDRYAALSNDAARWLLAGDQRARARATSAPTDVVAHPATQPGAVWTFARDLSFMGEAWRYRRPGTHYTTRELTDSGVLVADNQATGRTEYLRGEAWLLRDVRVIVPAERPAYVVTYRDDTDPGWREARTATELASILDTLAHNVREGQTGPWSLHVEPFDRCTRLVGPVGSVNHRCDQPATSGAYCHAHADEAAAIDAAASRVFDMIERSGGWDA